MIFDGFRSRWITPRACGVGHRLADRFEDPQQPRAIGVPIGAAGEHLGEGLAPDQPHGDVGPAIGEGAQLVDRDDPRMLELAADLRLFDEPTDHLGLVAELLAQHLDRQVATQVGIVPFEDDAHAATADHIEELQPLQPVGIGRLGHPGGRRRAPRARARAAEQHVRHPAQRLGQGGQDARRRRAHGDQQIVPIRFAPRRRNPPAPVRSRQSGQRSPGDSAGRAWPHPRHRFGSSIVETLRNQYVRRLPPM